LVQRFEKKWSGSQCGQQEVSEYGWRTEATSYRFSEVAGLEGCSPLESILSVMEGVTGQEGYYSEG